MPIALLFKLNFFLHTQTHTEWHWLVTWVLVLPLKIQRLSRHMVKDAEEEMVWRPRPGSSMWTVIRYKSSSSPSERETSPPRIRAALSATRSPCSLGHACLSYLRRSCYSQVRFTSSCRFLGPASHCPFLTCVLSPSRPALLLVNDHPSLSDDSGTVRCKHSCRGRALGVRVQLVEKTDSDWWACPPKIGTLISTKLYNLKTEVQVKRGLGCLACGVETEVSIMGLEFNVWWGPVTNPFDSWSTPSVEKWKRLFG